MHVVLSAVDEELREDLVVVQEDKLAEIRRRRPLAGHRGVEDLVKEVLL